MATRINRPAKAEANILASEDAAHIAQATSELDAALATIKRSFALIAGKHQAAAARLAAEVEAHRDTLDDADAKLSRIVSERDAERQRAKDDARDAEAAHAREVAELKGRLAIAEGKLKKAYAELS